MDPLTIAGAIATFAAGAAGLGYLIRGVCRMLGRINAFLADWHGRPARPGVEATPGVMARLQAIEDELTLNHGESLKDQVIALREDHAEHVRQQGG